MTQDTVTIKHTCADPKCARIFDAPLGYSACECGTSIYIWRDESGLSHVSAGRGTVTKWNKPA